jgi:biopolymer transport protein TolQ
VLKYFSILTLVSAPSALSVWKLIQDASPMVKFVLALLFFFSVWSWTIILWKFFQLRRAARASDSFVEKFWAAESLDKAFSEAGKFSESPMAKVFQAGYLELNRVRERRKKIEESGPEFKFPVRRELTGVENVQRAMNQETTKELNRLSYFLSFLATTGSTSPFIGLFGTVWGIMNSFRRLAILQSAGLAVVAPGISEALVATAAGLFAAIPAVIFYNYYNSRIQYLESGLENFSAEFINIIERHYLKKLSQQLAEGESD